MIYEIIKNKVVFPTILKTRENLGMLVAMNENSEIYYLNETAKDILLASNGKHSVEEIVDIIMQSYDVEKEILQSDIVSILRDLQWKNLVYMEDEK